MRLLLTPVFITSVCLSLVNGAQFCADSDDEQGFGMERSKTECFGNDDGEGERVRTYSASYDVESGVVTSSSSTDTVEIRVAEQKAMIEQRRYNLVRNLQGGKFPYSFAGIVPDTERTEESLTREARKNSLAPVVLNGGKPFLAIPVFSKAGIAKVSTGAARSAISRPSYMKRTTSLQQDLLDAL